MSEPNEAATTPRYTRPVDVLDRIVDDLLQRAEGPDVSRMAYIRRTTGEVHIDGHVLVYLREAQRALAQVRAGVDRQNAEIARLRALLSDAEQSGSINREEET